MPDIELLVVNYLNNQRDSGEGTEVLANGRFVTKVPFFLAPDAQAFPDNSQFYCRVVRASGATRSFFVDRPVVDIDVWAFDETRAVNVSALIENLLLFGLRASTQPEGTVQLITSVIGPHWLPDENQNLERRSQTVEIHAKPRRNGT